MTKQQQNNTLQNFDNLFNILSSPRFLNREGLGGNKAIFINPYPISKQSEVDVQIVSLVKRLQAHQTSVLSINLYEICLTILKNKGMLEKVFNAEKQFSKREFRRALQGSLDVKSVIVPYIKSLMENNEHQLVLIHDVDKVFPFISMVPILVNIQSILNNEPFVFFYPGDYDNYALNLFGRINEDNEYRAFNLNNYN